MYRKDALTYLEHTSSVLQGNPLQDPIRRVFPVYTPPDFTKGKNYPVFYYLAGWSGTGASLVSERAPFAQSIPDLLDEMIQKDPSKACLMVLPDCSVKLGSSQFINSEGTGRYMDYLCDEIVPFVEDEFQLSPDANLRGVLGHSSGGFGAMATGMLRPDVFAHVLSSAGDSFYECLYFNLIPGFLRAYEKHGSVEKMVDAFLDSPNPMRTANKDLSHSIMLLNVCLCYTPNASAPMGADLFFDVHMGNPIDEVWKQFKAWDPVDMVKQHQDALKKLSSFSLFAGAQDEYGIHLGHRQISNHLTSKGIPHVLEEFPGGHSGIYYKVIDYVKHMMKSMGLTKA